MLLMLTPPITSTALAASVAFLLVTTLAAPASAASYQKTDGSIVDPILFIGTSNIIHPYSGADLQPGLLAPGLFLQAGQLQNADLSGSVLIGANLNFSDLSDANLSNADLTGISLSATRLQTANLTNANVSYANLSGVNLISANLFGVDLRGSNMAQALLTFANLSGAHFGGVDLSRADLLVVTGSAFYDLNTDFTQTNFDPVAAGWILVPVIPEPSTALMMGLGLAGLAAQKRRETSGKQ